VFSKLSRSAHLPPFRNPGRFLSLGARAANPASTV
jgi:hypothetical protein